MENQRVTKIRSPVEPDSVDVSLDVWSRELPDLDLGIEGIVERIDKLKHYVDRAMQETLEAYDLSHGEWKLLANLRWAGPPYRGKPGVDDRDLCAVKGFIDEEKVPDQQGVFHAARGDPKRLHQERAQKEPDYERDNDRLGPVPEPMNHGPGVCGGTGGHDDVILG